MTKVEAIKLIDERMCFGRGKWSEHHMPEIDDYWKAGEMAIKALEQPEPQWIPCSERLPKDLEEVNVTWVNHNPEPYYSFVKDVPFTASAIHYKGKWFWSSSTCADVLVEYGNNNSDEVDSDVEITAWMPLPKPYKEGEKE